MSILDALPDILREHRFDLEDALSAAQLVHWADEDTYHSANQPAAIGRVLVEAIHTELANAHIAYVFRKKIAKRERIVLAQASKAGGKLEFFADVELLVEVNWTMWSTLSPAQRIALIDHELSHFLRDEDDKGNTVYRLVGHDVEEFGAIVKRWGLWQPDLKRFADVLHSAQIGLFAEAGGGHA